MIFMGKNLSAGSRNREDVKLKQSEKGRGLDKKSMSKITEKKKE